MATNQADAAVGFVGLGRLGSVMANSLVEAGIPVLCCRRGRSTELVAAGASIPGDGTPAAVAQATGVVFTCLPTEASLEAVVMGERGFLETDGPAPLVVEMSTVSIEQKARLREALLAQGGDLLDAPVSGTPAMAAAKRCVVYASGDPAAYAKVERHVLEMAPTAAFVGALGDGTRLKYVANLMAFVHLAAAAEAMAFAGALGLDQHMVAEILSKSPGATSGQFSARSKLMADGRFEGTLVTMAMTVEVADQIGAAAEAACAPTPMLSVVRGLFDDLIARGEGDSDPASMATFFLEQARAAQAVRAASEATEPLTEDTT